MTISIQYNGIELTNYLDAVIDITRNVGQNRTPSLEKVGHTDGKLFQYTTASEGTITITAIIRNQKTERRRYLAQALMQSEPAKLIFSDEPGVYYLAITTGQQTLAEQFLHNTLTLTFIVPDGIAHSVATQTADNTPYKDVPVNLLVNSSAKTKDGFFKNFDKVENGYGEVTIKGTNTYISIDLSDGFSIQPRDYKPGDKYTISMDVMFTSWNIPAGTTLTEFWIGQRYLSPSWQRICTINLPRDPSQMLNQWIRITQTSTIPPYADPSVNTNAIFNIGFAGPSEGSFTLRVRKPKQEFGSTASPWSPNPADPEYYSDTITVNNGGTYPVYPVISATMHSDNGLVAFVNDQGAVLQFGSSDEIDGVTKQRSETVYHYTFDTEPTDVVLNNGAVAYPLFNGNPATPNLQNGPFNYTRTPGTATPASIRTANMKWAGPSMSRKLGPNSAGSASGNFRFVNRVKFGTSVSSYGRTEYNLTYNGKVVISLLFYDNSSGLDQLVFEGTVGDQHLFIDNLPRKYYKDGEYDFSISKMGDKITFRLDRVNLGGGGVEMRVVNGLSDIEVDGMTCWFTGFSDTPGWTMNWEDSYFEWINVDYWSDIPNRFKAGDVVVADVGTKTVFVNGVEERTLQTVGNMWDSFKLQPGENTIRPLASTWANPFTAKIDYREAWY